MAGSGANQTQPVDPSVGASAAPVRAPSLFLRLAVSALVVLLVALGLIGLAVQQAYRSAAELALQERLEAAAFQVLAGMDVSPGGALLPPTNLGDSLLTQPASGLYAGVRLGAADHQVRGWQDGFLQGDQHARVSTRRLP